MSTATRTWWIDADDIADATATISKINARAAKRGLDGRFTATIGDTRREAVYDDEGARAVINGIPHYFANGQPVPCPLIGYRELRELIVEGDAPKFAGWTFIARLTWDGGTLVTRVIPGYEGRIDEASIRDGACDHCKADRRRNDCYLLENADGRRAQVGSTCIRDFLGQDFRPTWITWGDDLDAAITDAGSGPRYRDAAVLDILAWAASISSTTGWVSRAKAETEFRPSSGDVLRACLFGAGKAGREARDAYQPTAAHAAEAVAVRDWAATVEAGDSEYLANVRRLAAAEYVSERNTAILGSAVAAYWRERNAAAERAARPVSEFVGKPGERTEFTLTVRSDTPIDGDYGVSHLYTMTDAAGNCYKWFSSRNQDWAPGQDVKVKGTIKKHETYRDVKQTVLTRCTVVAAA